MYSKREFLNAAALTAGFISLSVLPVWAQGGDDPIEGIDIIVKEDPSAAPIRPYSLSGRDLDGFNALNGDDRPAYLMAVIAKHIDARDGFVRASTEALSKYMCSDCEIGREINIAFAADDVKYEIALRIQEKR